MAPIKTDITPWKWVESVTEENVTAQHILLSYRLQGPGLQRCQYKCSRNCRKNPFCLWGLGEKHWITNAHEDNSDEDVTSEFRKEDDFAGIINLGTTCYVNALLQLWFHNPILRPAILRWQPPYGHNFDDYQPQCALGELQAVFARMKLSKRSAINPTKLVESLHLDTGEQQDAQEFAKLFMTVLSGLANEDDVNKELNRAFEGTWEYETECKRCKLKKSNQEKFTEIDLCVKDTKDTGTSFIRLFKEEELVGDNQYFCQNCNGKADAIRRFKLISLPPVLNIQLLRFVYDKEIRRKKKLTSQYTFPEYLDMAPYVQSAASSSDKGDEVKNNLKYQLTGYLVHNGKSASSGHYVAHIRDIRTGAWLIFNDDDVSEQKSTTTPSGKNSKQQQQLSEEDAMDQDEKCGGEYKSTGAYMLVYTHQSLINQPTPDPEIPANLRKLVELEDAAFETEFQTTRKEREHKALYLEQRKEGIEALYYLLVPDKEIVPVTKNEENSTKIIKMSESRDPLGKDKENEGHENSVEHHYHNIKSKDVGKRGLGKNGKIDAKEMSKINAIFKSKEYDRRPIDKMDFLPYTWLTSWLSPDVETVPELVTDTIQCPHNKLSLAPGTTIVTSVKYKCIPTEVADILYAKYGTDKQKGYRLTGTKDLCRECVVAECRRLKCLSDLESYYKTAQELLAATAKQYETYKRKNDTIDYSHDFWSDKLWVSKSSVKKWRSWIKGKYSLDSQEPDSDVLPTVEEPVFNEDIRCVHGKLTLDENLRRPVCAQTWSIFQKYFPNCFSASVSETDPCTECQDLEQQNSQVVQENRKFAEKLKESLPDLIRNKNRPSQVEKCQAKYYFVNDDFVKRLIQFVRSPDKTDNPDTFGNSELLCPHNKFMYPISCMESINNYVSTMRHADIDVEQLKKWQLVTSDEWDAIKENFSVDHEISVNMPSDAYSPDVCIECGNQWWQGVLAHARQFHNKSIYFRPYSQESDSGHSQQQHGEEEDAPHPAKKVRMSSRSRRGKQEKKADMSSSDTVKKLKHCLVVLLANGVMASDITLYHNNKELKDDSQTLSSLQITPDSLIEYTTESINGYDETMFDVESSQTPETGFAGTMLQLRLNDDEKMREESCHSDQVTSTTTAAAATAASTTTNILTS